MADDYKVVRENGSNGSNGTLDLMTTRQRPTWDLSPREPLAYDYLLILRKHRWLVLSSMLAVVTIVSIATFRMQPVYVATARIELGRENTNILAFRAPMRDYMMDVENYTGPIKISPANRSHCRRFAPCLGGDPSSEAMVMRESGQSEASARTRGVFGSGRSASPTVA
jgi:hypothetical protein